MILQQVESLRTEAIAPLIGVLFQDGEAIAADLRRGRRAGRAHPLHELDRRRRRRGVAVVFITHALDEALKHSDRITVMRDGKRIRTCDAADLSRPELIALMIGDVVQGDFVQDNVRRQTERTIDRATRQPALAFWHVACGRAVKDMSFAVFAGEIVGLTGLVGSGRTEVAKLAAGVFGRSVKTEGGIELRGTPVFFATPRKAMRAGVIYVTEDRKRRHV